MSEVQLEAGEQPFKNHGWRVTFAGLGINLALGVLYTWSVISGGVDARLTVTSGPDAETAQVVAVGATAVSIGRDVEKGHLKLTDEAVSKKHAVIAYDKAEDVYKLSAVDQGELLVNGKPLTAPTVLESGDQIKLGGTVLGFKNGWGWTQSDKQWPYAIACLIFSIIMVPAGRMQDKLGPRLVATIGGILVGAGLILASFTTSPLGYIIGFGILAGAGIGFGYASATPPAVKWFPPAKTGMIAGIVVSGFGLAMAYMGPLGATLINGTAEWKGLGLQTTVLIFGISFIAIVVGLAQLLRPPHRVLQFVKGLGPAGEMKAADNAPVKKENFTPTEMLRTWQFWVMWFLYACGAGAGLMVISVALKVGKTELGVIVLITMGIGNGAGRLIAGVVSDKIGRKATLMIFLILQAAMVGLLAWSEHNAILGSAASLALLAALIGANYGSNLSLFPSFTKDFYGLKNFGMNYGLVFTAWGVGGFMLAKFAGWVYDGLIVASWKGSFMFAFLTSSALLIVGAVVVLLLKPPHHTEPADQAA